MHLPSKPKIGIFVSFSGRGGVERMIVNLSEGLIALGCSVDLVLVKARSAYLDELPSEVNVVKLGSSHALSSLPALIQYLRGARLTALLAAKDRANQVAILSKRLSGVSTRVVVRMGTNVSAALRGRHPLREWIWYLPMRLTYPLADGVVAVSKGVAADVARITGLPLERLHVIPNPVATPRLFRLAREPIGHPWFGKGQAPVILGVGRLTRQKDFPTLIKAFAAVRPKRRCRLVILGDGRDQAALRQLAEQMGVKDDFDLPGFVENPYPFIKGASLFVLSSLWEGSPNVLTEALVLGVPSVATDCPSGPRDIMAGGRYGPLVPVGDEHAMAEAMLATLASPPDGEFLKQAAKAYTLENSSKKYLEALLGSKV
jgi:glycosyltransferase involved in cell wall biosynthesis